MSIRQIIPKDIYLKSRWKAYLGLAGVIIVFLTLVFVNYLAQRLKEGEESKVKIFVNAYQRLADLTDEEAKIEDVTNELSVIENTKDIPIIITDLKDKPVKAKNFGSRNEDPIFLTRQLNRIKKTGPDPIVLPDGSQKVYYRYSRYYTLLAYFPLIQGVLLLTFITLGYIGFSAARRSEQNQVWVGMAKETAHQLGTPISAIMAWVEHLKEMIGSKEEEREVLVELSNDVDRLKLIADRFSKIGSAPVLEATNIYEELDKCRAYMEKRAPRKVRFDFPKPDESNTFVRINPPLFDWVIENLLRNALDAMEGKGEIKAVISEEGDYVLIDISDTGKGIHPSKFKTVFQPGFTTKARGWGLGLSLARRIVEVYHRGKIFVKSSQLNEGTTFSIKLPKAT